MVKSLSFNLCEVMIDTAVGTIVGDEGNRGVSGGERRRDSIAIDIIHDPIFLFLDESTSGLDSTSAFMVIKTLQQIARTESAFIVILDEDTYWFGHFLKPVNCRLADMHHNRFPFGIGHSLTVLFIFLLS